MAGSNDERFPGADIAVCQVDSGKTRIVFNYRPLSGVEQTLVGVK